jgi:hypothetical protein
MGRLQQKRADAIHHSGNLAMLSFGRLEASFELIETYAIERH